MTKIKTLKNWNEDHTKRVPIAPRTHTKAVYDDNGNTLDSLMGLQDEKLSELGSEVSKVGNELRGNAELFSSEVRGTVYFKFKPIKGLRYTFTNKSASSCDIRLKDLTGENVVQTIGISVPVDGSVTKEIESDEVGFVGGYSETPISIVVTCVDNVRKELDYLTEKSEQISSELGSYYNSSEYARAYTDANGRFLWGIKQDGSIEFAKGVPTPIKNYIVEFVVNRIDNVIAPEIETLKEAHEQYLKESENPEWARVIVDVEGKVLWGIRQDGSVEFTKGVPMSIKSYIDSLDRNNDEEVERINQLVIGLLADVKELNETYQNKQNPEWIQVTTDSKGKILEGIGNDGKKYFPKQEMLEKYNDIEGRTEMTIDIDGRILSFRDSNGMKVENKQHTFNASFGNLILTDSNAVQIKDALNLIGFTAKSLFDWSDESFVEILVPNECAKINIISNKLPYSNTDSIDGHIELWDKNGNYFKKPITALEVQGDSSRSFEFKNFAFDIADGSAIKFGNWVAQDSFHLKKYYIDSFRGQCVVAYWLAEQIYQTHQVGNRKPYEYLYNTDSILSASGNFSKDMPIGALTHPDGFPVMLYHNGELVGLYAWCLKKHRDNYAMKKSNSNHIILDGELSKSTIWKNTVDWAAFEVRNPKGLIDINEEEYDGDNPKELSNTDKLSMQVKSNIVRLSAAIQDIKSQTEIEQKREKYKEYFNVDYVIDYFILGNVIGDFDGFAKNWIWCTWDGKIWSPTVYDKDSIFGSSAQGTAVRETMLNASFGTDDSTPSGLMWSLFKNEAIERYKSLVECGVISVDNILGLLYKWLDKVGYDNLKEDIEKCCTDSDGVPQTPSYRDPKINEGWELIGNASNPNMSTYKPTHEYSQGDICDYCNPENVRKWGLKFRATKTIKGVPPLYGFYSQFPTEGGYYNSPIRVKNWLVKRFDFLNSNLFV